MGLVVFLTLSQTLELTTDAFSKRELVELTRSNRELTNRIRKMSYQRKFQEDMQRATGRFQDLVQENKVMMFSSTNCGYCDVAKETFASLGTQFKSLEVNKLGVDGAMMRNTLKSVTGERTVPAIFICGEPVKGGSNGLTELASSGRLSNMLERCCNGDLTCGSMLHHR